MNQDKKKKVFITLPCLLRGGTEIQSLLLAGTLMKLMYEVSVICYHEYDDDMVDEFRIKGLRVILLDYPRSISKLKILTRLTSLFKSEKPEVVHVQYIAPAATVILAARMARIRTIFATVHQMGTQFGLKEHMLLRLSSLLCSRMTFVSLAAQQSWLGTKHLYDAEIPGSFNKRCGTIYNTVDTDEIAQIQHRTGKDALKKKYGLEQKFVIGAVSRLRYEKGMDILVSTFAKISSKYPYTHLLITGDGPDREKLRIQALDAGINERITWTGALAWNETIQAMGVFDLAVMPSRFEGFGLTLLEEMALGLPVIATLCGGPEEIIENEISGLLVPVENVNALSKAMEELINDAGKRKSMGDSARTRVKAVFSIPRFSKQIKHLYQTDS